MYTNIFIFGDSVSFGCYDAIGGWAQRFDNFLAGEFISGRGAEYWVYNQSTPIGDTSKDILDRLEVELKPRMRNGDNKENILIFAIGINDSAFAHDKNDQWVVLADFKNNLKNLMLISKKIIPKVIFIGLTPVNQELTDPASFDNNYSYRNEDIKKYDRALRDVAKENGAEYIPIFDKFAAADYKQLFHDGAHPNSAGHQLIFEIVRDYLLGKKII